MNKVTYPETFSLTNSADTEKAIRNTLGACLEKMRSMHEQILDLNKRLEALEKKR